MLLPWILAYVCALLTVIYAWLSSIDFYNRLKMPVLAPPLIVYALVTTALMVCQMVACILIDLDHPWIFGITAQVIALVFSVLAQVFFFSFRVYNFVTIFLYAVAAVFESLACWQFLNANPSTIWLVVPSAVWYVFLTASTFFIWVKNHRYPMQISTFSERQ